VKRRVSSSVVRVWLALTLTIAALLTHPRGAAADVESDKATARELFYDASAAMAAGEYASAANLFGRSHALYATPTAALGEARALVQVGRLVEAYERYQGIVNRPLADDASAAFRNAVKSASQERETVKRQIPMLVIVVRDHGPAEVLLDGEPVPAAALGSKRPVNPGRHRIRATRSHAPTFSTEVEVAKGEVLEVFVELLPSQQPAEPAVSGPPRPQSPRRERPPSSSRDGSSDSLQSGLGWTLVGLGALSGVVWGVTGAAYLGEQSAVDAECDADKRCSQEGLDAADRGRTLGAINTVSFIGALASVGVGLALVLTADDEPDAVSVRTALSISGPRAGLEVRF